MLTPTEATTPSILNDTITITTTTIITTLASNVTTSDTAPYDAEGAMKFTVAVVLVFGVGVIGLLGIYHRHNVNEDLSDKEADEFVKRFERKRYHIEKQYRKRLMLDLVASFFSKRLVQNPRERSGTITSLRPTRSEPNLLQGKSLLADQVHKAGDYTPADLPDRRSTITHSPHGSAMCRLLQPHTACRQLRPKSVQLGEAQGAGVVGNGLHVPLTGRQGRVSQTVLGGRDSISQTVLGGRDRISPAVQGDRDSNSCSNNNEHEDGSISDENQSVLAVPRIVIDDLFVEDTLPSPRTKVIFYQ